MEKLTLSAFVSRNGQEKAAEVFNCRQSAISKAISSGRNITVTILENGKVIAEELKPFPSNKRDIQPA
ncbi:Cro/CI family transcriptional regulator [Tatumella terrea]|uniref:Cro/CI family transcriptional regulator n=1 Tax=Tatumella terrea TaxID=419007 RepID=UPI0031DE917A